LNQKKCLENRGTKNRILITLGSAFSLSFWEHTLLPGIDATQLSGLAGQTKSGIGSILRYVYWWSISKASVFCLGIMPYISASICSVDGNCYSYLQKLQKDGESGRKDQSNYTLVNNCYYLVSRSNLHLNPELCLTIFY
jgi:preprotein translocase subunit SecY